VLLILADLFLSRGIPTHIRSDNGPEFIANTPRQLRNALQVAPLYIEPGSPCENGYVESFNGKMREQCLNGELFYTLKEAQTMTEPWRTHYNLVRPHRSLGGRPPAPETVQLAN
jgi:putative transposase